MTKQEIKPNESTVFNADVKRMSDIELEASLKELREMTYATQAGNRQTSSRRRAA